MATYDALLFDLDGTLVDTVPEISDAVNATLSEFGLGPVSPDQIRGWVGHGAAAVMAEALASVQGAERKLKLDTLMPAFERNYYWCCGKRSRTYPGVEVALDALARRGVPMALITNKEGKYVRRVLRAHRLDRFFVAMTVGDSLATRKPDPLTVQTVLAQFRVTPPCALLVGDSEIDIQTARNAKVPVWLVSYGYCKVAARDAGADRVITTLVDLLPAVRSRQRQWMDRAHAGEE